MSSPKRIRDSEIYPDWQNLPIELSAAVAKRVTAIGDYISFRGVCSSWRSAATFDNFDREFPRVPWLMYVSEKREEKTVLGDDPAEKREEKTNLGDDVAEKQEEKMINGDGVAEKGEEKTILGDDVAEKGEEKTIPGDDVAENREGKTMKVTNFFDLESKTHKVTNFHPAVGILNLSWSGWILYVLNDSVDVKLTHPIWRIKIELPGLDTFPPYENSNLVIRKMVLSSSPTMKIDLVVMVIWGDKKQLGFCRPGDSSWTVMAPWDGSFCDIIYHNRRLYAVDSSLRVVECDVHGPNPTQTLLVFVLPYFDHELGFDNVMYYLVESSGKFLIVSRHYMFRCITICFRIFEFDLMDGSHNEIHDLGNRALFLGSNSSICFELSAWSKIKPNRIYFTDNIGQCGIKYSDMGIYKLSKQSIKHYFDGFLSVISRPTTWVVPSF